MYLVGRIKASIATTILAVAALYLLLMIGMAAAQDNGVKFPGSDWITPTIARADSNDDDTEGDDQPEEEGNEDVDEHGNGSHEGPE